MRQLTQDEARRVVEAIDFACAELWWRYDYHERKMPKYRQRQVKGFEALAEELRDARLYVGDER